MPEILSNLNVNYVEYGKVFTESGSTDFQLLDYSDEATLSAAGRKRCEYYMDWGLDYPDPPSKTPFSAEVGRVSVTLVKLRSGYLFTQIQRREEGELSRSLGMQPRINRRYNQVRFNFLPEEVFQERFSNDQKLYEMLLFQNKRSLAGTPYGLKDYTESGQQYPFSAAAERDVSKALDEQYEVWVEIIVNALAQTNRQHSDKYSVLVETEAVDWFTKLQIVQRVQYIMFPLIGVVTFAFDYVTEQNVILRLFDKPAPETRNKPAQRISTDDFSKGRSADEYYQVVKSISQADLYSQAFQDCLVQCEGNSQQAVRIYRMAEKGADKSPSWVADGLIEEYAVISKKPEQLKKVLGHLDSTAKIEMLSRHDVPLRLKADLLVDLLVDNYNPGKQDRQAVYNALVGCYPILKKESGKLPLIVQNLDNKDVSALVSRVDIPQELTLDVLQEKSAGMQLDEFILLYLAVPAAKRNDQLQNLLRKNVGNSKLESIERIRTIKQDGVLEEIYDELLRVCKLQKPRQQVHQWVRLQSDMPGREGKTTLEALLQYRSFPLGAPLNRLIKAAGGLESEQVKDILVILGRLRELAGYWWLITKINVITSGFYNLVLSKVVQAGWHDLLKKSPESYRSILEYGRKLYALLETEKSQEVKSADVQAHDHQNPLLDQAFNPNFMEALVNASLNAASASINFAEWYFYEELIQCKDFQKFFIPYRERISQALLQPDSDRPSEDFIFLMKGRLPSSGMSILKACRYGPSEKSFNESSYLSLIRIWLKDEQPIPIGDIIYLVGKLPGTNALLSALVNNPAAGRNICLISPETAIRWLRATRNDNLRVSYQDQSGKDLLFLALQKLEKQTPDFIWELLVVDDSSLPTGISWSSYLQLFSNVTSVQDNKLEYFLGIARQYNDETDTHGDLTRPIKQNKSSISQVRNVIRIKSEFINNNQAVLDLSHRDLNDLLAYNNTQASDNKVQTILVNYLNNTNSGIYSGFRNQPDVSNLFKLLDRLELMFGAAINERARNRLYEKIIETAPRTLPPYNLREYLAALEKRAREKGVDEHIIRKITTLGETSSTTAPKGQGAVRQGDRDRGTYNKNPRPPLILETEDSQITIKQYNPVDAAVQEVRDGNSYHSEEDKVIKITTIILIILCLFFILLVIVAILISLNVHITFSF